MCNNKRVKFAAWRKGLQSAAPSKTKKNAHNTLRLEFNEDLWDNLYGFTSHPIEKRPGRKVCIRVISQFGEESSKVLEMKSE